MALLSAKSQVAGSTRDLPQGRLEIPCTLSFEGDEKYIEKVKKLVKLSDLETKKLSQ